MTHSPKAPLERAQLNKPNKPKKLLKCSICGETIYPHPISGWAGGNNAWPINNGRCCQVCDDTVVIPTRIRRIMHTYQKPKDEA
jgi:hypothetical protein